MLPIESTVLSISTSKNRFSRVESASLNDAEKSAIIDLALAVLRDSHQPGVELTSPDSTRAYLRLLLSDRENEVFGCIFVDNKHCVIDIAELFYGTINEAAIYPRVAVQKALAVNAAAVIVFHNHPSGNADPSQADISVTRKLKAAFDTVDIRLLDHLIVATSGTVSLAERGII